MARDSEASEAKPLTPPTYPGTRPKPHEAKIYYDAMVECIASHRLSNTVDGKLPSRGLTYARTCSLPWAPTERVRLVTVLDPGLV